MTINPIIVSGNAGIPATFFGDSTQQATIEGFIDTIMSQAGIDVEWLVPQTYQNEFLYNATARQLNQFEPLTPVGIVNTVPEVVNMWFVNAVPGALAPGYGSINGIAIVDGEGAAVSAHPSLLTDFGVAGLEAIAGVTAHELVHNLGLDHITDTNNLLNVPVVGHELTAGQVSTIFTDDPLRFDGFDLLVEVAVVPEPGPAFLLLLAFGAIFSRRGR
ncbi:MAG: PEP-CTERM sorting domain-containing protein [Verrucomicrobiota bacterium]